MLFLFYRMDKLYLLVPLLVLLNHFSFAQNSAQNLQFSKEDSIQIIHLKNDLKSASNQQKLKILFQLGSIHLGHNNPQATVYADQLLEESKLAKDDNPMAMAYYLKGKTMAIKSNIKALDYFKLATDNFREIQRFSS